MVIRRAITRVVSIGATFAAVMTIAAGLLPGTAQAATGKPTAVQITGKFPGGRLTVQAKDARETFDSLVGQVDWLTNSTPMATPPQVDKLGAKFTLTILINDAPQRVFDVYPLAVGGPRIYRPAKQPDFRKSKAGWFYGELTMSDAMRAAGAPLPERRDAISGGIGGGERIVRAPVLNPAGQVPELVTDMRRLVLLNGAVALTIALGLAGMAFLIRRKV